MCLCRPARFSGKNINRLTHVYVALHNVCITLSGNYLIKKNVTDEPDHNITGSVVMVILIYNVYKFSKNPNM